MNTKQVTQALVAVVSSIITYMFGGWSTLIQILLAFVAVDYLTGLMSAAVNGELSSKVGFRGIAKKVFVFILVAVGHLADLALGTNSIIQDAVCYFYMANEFISILENAGKIGLPVPDILKNAVKALQGKEQAANEDTPG